MNLNLNIAFIANLDCDMVLILCLILVCEKKRKDMYNKLHLINNTLYLVIYRFLCIS